MIVEPDHIYEDYEDKENKRCYYGKYSTTTYIKVVIWINDNPCKVVSAYEVDYIKEVIYSGIKQIK